MKKITLLGLILGLVLVTGLLAGCGAKTTSKETAPTTNSGASSTNQNTGNAATENIVDVPADTVGDNPDAGTNPESDIPVITDELPA